jgi:sec-independent protein translocase protein TatC
MGPKNESLDWIEHLEELRKRLFVILLAVALASTFAAFFTDTFLKFLIHPIRPLQEKLYFLTPYEAFLVKVGVVVFAGVLLASPVIFAQLWRFVAPGLYEKEKKVLAVACATTLGFFLAGVAFGFFIALPFALKFLLGFQSPELAPLISLKEYFSFLNVLLLGFGAAFCFPVFILLLVRLGILRAEVLIRQRKIAVVLIFIIAAVLTPPDVLSQLLLAFPLLGLYELTVVLARRLETK